MKKTLFIFILTSLSATTYAQTEVNSKEYGKLRNYIFENFTPRNVREKGISVFTMVKYYIDPNGSTDSIIPSDNMYHELRQHVIDMDKETINWNLILPASQQERIVVIPIFITALDKRDSTIKVPYNKPASYFLKMFSFDENKDPLVSPLYLLKPFIALYYSKGTKIIEHFAPEINNKHTPRQRINPVRKLPIDTITFIK